jgi:ribosomal protein L37AE/L43A
MTQNNATIRQPNQPVCPKCGSKQILYRVRTNDYLCRRCGNTFKKVGHNE